MIISGVQIIVGALRAYNDVCFVAKDRLHDLPSTNSELRRFRACGNATIDVLSGPLFVGCRVVAGSDNKRTGCRLCHRVQLQGIGERTLL